MTASATRDTGSTRQASATAYPWLAKYPPGVDWEQTFTPRPIFALLDDAVARFADKPCTNFLGKVTSYGDIGSLVERAAAGLQKEGVGKGTRVGLFLPNSPTFVVYYFAILKVGGVVVNYNPLYTLEELTFQVKDSGTELMITLDLKLLFDKVEGLLQSGVLARAVVCPFSSLLPSAKSILFRVLKRKQIARVARSPAASRTLSEARLLANDGRYRQPDIDIEGDTAVLQYTGGTTGTPKGAMLTHANVYINVLQAGSFAPELKDAEEKMLGILPFFHVFAMTVVLNFSIAKACEIIIMPKFVLDDALKLINDTRPTVMPGVPTLFNAIMNHPKLESFDLASLKYCLSGGAPLAIEIKQRFEALTGCKLVEGYGLSEASPVVTANPLDGPVKPGSIGVPLPATVVSLRDLADPMREVAAGERGELCVRGPQVMKGYWRRPEETAGQFVDGFLRTGDVAVMDEDGYIYLVDRIKDLIICSGYNVYPRRVEEAIYQHPAVEEVTVIGIRDEHRGEAPKAFIKLRPDMTASKADILSHLESRLSRIEMPSEVEFRDQLPKTMIGKLSKKELKQEEEARAAAHAARGRG
ncbi:MAG: long-chain fatty acid--CoA ligase [Hyphomicrobiaceae bacterium]|nr:long-chain fatty acid--CoA ligase [Hyphomicrobiaceae bacterium]